MKDKIHIVSTRLYNNLIVKRATRNSYGIDIRFDILVIKSGIKGIDFGNDITISCNQVFDAFSEVYNNDEYLKIYTFPTYIHKCIEEGKIKDIERMLSIMLLEAKVVMEALVIKVEGGVSKEQVIYSIKSIEFDSHSIERSFEWIKNRVDNLNYEEVVDKEFIMGTIREMLER